MAKTLNDKQQEVLKHLANGALVIRNDNLWTPDGTWIQKPHNSTLRSLAPYISRQWVQFQGNCLHELAINDAGMKLAIDLGLIDVPVEVVEVDELTQLKADYERLLAVVNDIIASAPKTKPVEDEGYTWESLKEGREMAIASSHFTYGDELKHYSIARKLQQALKGGE